MLRVLVYLLSLLFLRLWSLIGADSDHPNTLLLQCDADSTRTLMYEGVYDGTVVEGMDEAIFFQDAFVERCYKYYMYFIVSTFPVYIYITCMYLIFICGIN
jgi:hypothetical protein